MSEQAVFDFAPRLQLRSFVNLVAGDEGCRGPLSRLRPKRALTVCPPRFYKESNGNGRRRRLLLSGVASFYHAI